MVLNKYLGGVGLGKTKNKEYDYRKALKITGIIVLEKVIYMQSDLSMLLR